MTTERSRQPDSLVKTPTQTLSSSSFRTTKEQFAHSMAMLTRFKRTSNFTADELRAWHGFLGGYSKATIDKAVLMLAATETRFPELADLFQLCRKIERVLDTYSPHGTGERQPVYEKELKAIAERLRIEI